MKPPIVRPARISVRYDARLTASDGHESHVVVSDVSSRGFRIQIEDELIVGERIELEIGKQGIFVGEIVWVRGREAGGVFL